MRSVATTEMRSIGDTDVPGFIARGETTYECEYKFIKNGPVRSKSGEKTLRDRFKEVYKSTAQCAAEEWALPVPARPAALPQILGTNADRELYHSVHHRTGSWKANTVPFMWERCQERCLSEDSKKCRSRGAGLSASKPRLLQREQQRKYLIGKPKETEQLATPADVHIHRPPGYAGFVPRLPVVPSAPRDPRVALSSSALTYRPLPSTELRIAKYAHKGPLSKLVTTTSPCNPFKKGTVYPDQRFR